ncbi:helix-turn-helix transcriptional regulator [Amycolatopsis jejuensis]|uniref:helix-turn-helix transcriptional regulator n=1 Tax=Amycolatopsis jejuensis TaxID=330084 RepID=UPI000526B0F5|nr:LuxR family transcriptional regulator [Amycolatopsis jejuensis]
MGRHHVALRGREDVLTTLRGQAHAPGTLTLLCGSRGSGRTVVLAQLGRELSSMGITVLSLSGKADRPEWDRLGGVPILEVLRERFEEFGGDSRLTEAMDGLSRLCTAAAYADPVARARLVGALGTVFDRLRATGRVALLVDDVDAFASPAPALAEIRHAGHLVFVSCAESRAADLRTIADEVVRLDPLADPDAAAVLRQTAGLPLDELLQQALCDDLGPLYGNPGTLVSTVVDLRRRGRLVVVQGHLCLRDPGTPIALGAGHPLVAEVAADGRYGSDLVALAAADAGFWVDEVSLPASATGEPAAAYGRAVDRLVLAGVLDADPIGRLAVCCPALAAAVAEGAGSDDAPVGLLIARQMLETGEGARSVLLRHVAVAGRAMAPHPELVGLLREAEVRMPVMDTAGHAAYRYAAWWHAEPGGQRTRLAFDLVRLFMRTGDYSRLAAFVPEMVPDLPTEGRPELSAATALAALHLHRPVTHEVRAALTGAGPEPAALVFCDRWFGGEPVTVADLEAAFAPLLQRSGGTPTLEWRTRRRRKPTTVVEEALGARDLVPVLEAVLGSQYGSPLDGPLATYHRVRSGFASEDWAAALSAARRLELEPDADPVARQHARLYAAEMCFWRGEDRRMADWLAAADEQAGLLPAMRAWVELARDCFENGAATALQTGWRAVEASRDHADVGGFARLLRRLAAVAAEAGETLQARRVEKEAELLDARVRSAGSRETALHVSAVLHADPAKMRAVEGLVRRHGTRADLSAACLLVGLVAADPQPWLAEGLEIARAIGAVRLTARAKKAMEDRGLTVAVPRGESGAGELSDTELRILGLIRRGQTNRQIARAVGMSEKTVEKYLTRLFAKAGCRTRHGLATSGLGGTAESVGA